MARRKKSKPLQFDGLDEYIQLLDVTTKESRQIIGGALYTGAKVMTDTVRNSLEANVPIDESWSRKDRQKKGIKAVQKRGLLDSLGIATEQVEDGAVNVKIGFDGYNENKTTKFPNGEPNMLIARTINSGTSWLPKTGFMQKAISQGKAQAEAVMVEYFDSEIKKLGGK